jgi:hypothetical protein
MLRGKRVSRTPDFYRRAGNAYNTGDGLQLSATAEFPDIARTPRSVVALALAIHDYPQEVANVFKDPQGRAVYNVSASLNLYSRKPTILSLEEAKMDAPRWATPSIGWATIDLTHVQQGLRVGDEICGVSEAVDPEQRFGRYLHASQYDVSNPLELLVQHEGRFISTYDDPTIATRTSLVKIYTPHPGKDGPISVQLYDSNQGSETSPVEVPFDQRLDDLRAYICNMTTECLRAFPPAAP